MAEYEHLDKIWYIDNDLRYPAIVMNRIENKEFYSIMVYYGGIWESLLSSPDNLRTRTQDWSNMMFEFRSKTMNIDNIEWEFN